MFRLLFALSCLLAFAPPAVAGPAHIRAELVAETASPAAGSAATIALRMRPDKGWHGYWQNPGDAGAATRFEWRLPPGVTVSEPRYPVPERLIVAGLMNHVFNGEHALLLQLTVPKAAFGTKLPIRVTVDWLACTEEICVPERGDLALDLTIGNGTIAPADRAAFDGWRAKLPRPLGSQARFAVDGKILRIGIPYPGTAPVAAPWFYAVTQDAVDYAHPQIVRRDGDRLIVETVLTGGAPQALDGVLAIGPEKGLEIQALPGAVPAGGEVIGGAERSAAWDWRTILFALAGAILGGALLNIMPCVFPVVSLKALSLARVGGNERTAKRDALAYTAGVIATCLAMGWALLALRAGGMAVGWAFQLQDPRVILGLLILATAITLNFLGLFHLRGFGGGESLAGQGGAAGSFWTGALAAFVATPCTGPFMAAALGAALVLPAAAALAIFAGLGLGLALPFLLLGFVPALRRRMPKPGGWMVAFQRWMALPMALTAAALLWLLWRQTGQTGLAIGAAAITATTLLVWWLGRRVPGGSGFVPALAGLAMVVALAAILLPAPTIMSASTPAGAIPFSESRLAALRAEGKPVFLYFTADWCLTCKVNEKAAIERDEVVSAFKAKGVVTMVGDWTNGDPVITRFLESRGRSGVPLYLLYAKGAEPKELPQVLTVAILTGAI